MLAGNKQLEFMSWHAKTAISIPSTNFKNVDGGGNSGFLSLSRKKSKVQEIAKYNPIRNWCYMTRFLTNFQNVDVGGSWCGIAERAEGTGGAAARWREIEHIQIWVRRNFSHVLTWSIKALGLLVVASLATGKKKQVLYVALLCADPPSWRFPVERGDQNVCGHFDIPTYYYISTIVPT